MYVLKLKRKFVCFNKLQGKVLECTKKKVETSSIINQVMETSCLILISRVGIVQTKKPTPIYFSEK